MKKLHISLMVSSSAVLVMLIAACIRDAGPAPLPTGRGASTTAPVGELSWEARWNEILAAARKEGSLTIYGATGTEMRQEVSNVFDKKFGIQTDWVFGRANEVVQRAMMERRANIFNADVFVDAATSIIETLMPTGALKPIEADLILPEAKDPSKWYWGKLKFLDEEVGRTHIIYAAFPQSSLAVNTDLVKKSEIQSYRDLLAPKWKERMMIDDPMVAGSGNGWFTTIGYKIMGIDYLRELARQKPMPSRDRRMQHEWLARGKNPILIAPSTEAYTEFKRAGAPLELVVPKEGTWLSQSRGSMSLMNNAPHPNAAIVYLNWALSREGQEVISRAEGYQSARTDVPTDFLDPNGVRQPGVIYHDIISLEFQRKRLEYLEIAREIFAGSIK